jgi:dGTPase
MTDTSLGLTKEKLEKLEDERLAPWAMKSMHARRVIEMPAEGRSFYYRTEYERDRDRIIHSRSFRRLKHKTQVFIPYEGDLPRTRLTHTVEVSQISRVIARALNLNEDLTEAIALGHDLGHTPFGHSGESVLHQIFTGRETLGCIDPKVSSRVGGFKHNYQSLRVVDCLEKRYNYEGLNLTFDVREGILKHTDLNDQILYPDMDLTGLTPGRPCFLEGQIVSLADELAQQSHDLEDGLNTYEVPIKRVEKLKIAEQVMQKISEEYRRSNDFQKRNLLIRGIIHLCVTDIVVHSAQKIHDWASAQNIRSAADFREKRDLLENDLVSFSPKQKDMFRELKTFVHQYIINSFSVNRADGRARHFIKALFKAYYLNPRQLHSYVLLRYKEREKIPYLRDVPAASVGGEIKKHYQGHVSFLRFIGDHIAGMSDQYALDEFEKLFLPHPRLKI